MRLTTEVRTQKPKSVAVVGNMFQPSVVGRGESTIGFVITRVEDELAHVESGEGKQSTIRAELLDRAVAEGYLTVMKSAGRVH